MSWDAWIIFAGFWSLFVVTPGPNAVNCITNGMTVGFRRGLWAVLAILTQASLFLGLSALGVTALIVASPKAFLLLKLLGAGVLIWLGIRGWVSAKKPVRADERPAFNLYWRALVIATINPKSFAGYLAAFSLFVQPDAPIGQQMWMIVPTALSLTALSYCTYTALGAGMGRAALGAVFHVGLRRVLAGCFIFYGVLLAGAATPGRG